VDQSRPDYIEIQSPQGIIGTGRQEIEGFVFDQSGVPTITVEIAGGASFACTDPSPYDRQWTCPITLTGFTEGVPIILRAQATDEHGQKSKWFESVPLEVKTTPPELSLSDASQAILADGWLGPRERTLSGSLSGNGPVDNVEICVIEDNGTSDGDVFCNAADLFTVEHDPTFVYEDVPPAPVAIGAGTTCSGGEIVRTFTVTETFDVADLDVGLSISHTYRNDLHVTLYAPSGVSATLVSRAAAAANLDVLLNDAEATLIHHRWDGADHDVGGPFPHLLSRFVGEAVQGTWRLEICDSHPTEDDGAYLRSRLVLRADAVPPATTATCPAWDLPVSGG
jgi:hypothetical protein